MRGEGRVFQRSSRWWIAYWGFKPKGDTGEVRESADATEDETRDLLKKRIREVANHHDGVKRFQGPNQERVTVEELLDNLVAEYRQRPRARDRGLLEARERVSALGRAPFPRQEG